MIRLEGINKSFGRLHVLRDVSLEIQKGEVVCLIGPSGAGKSTLLRCINHLEPLDSGTIYIEDIPVYRYERGGQTVADPEHKIEALRSAGDTDHILQAVKVEKSPELRAEGIRLLGSKADAGDSLVALWANEQDQQVKYAILDALNSERNAKGLVDLARKEKDPQMKREIVRRLSNMQSKEAADYLMELLK